MESQNTIKIIIAHQGRKTCQEPFEEVFHLPPEGYQSNIGYDQSSNHLEPKNCIGYFNEQCVL